jgi:hypothetical protein
VENEGFGIGHRLQESDGGRKTKQFSHHMQAMRLDGAPSPAFGASIVPI